MGVFISSSPPPTTQVATMTMISSTASDMSKGKAIAETPSLSPFEALYDGIQSTFDHLLIHISLTTI